MFAGAIVLFAALSPSAHAGAAPSALRCPDCNVVMIMIDVLRADELKVGGSAASIMPNLDELASRSAAFSNAFSPAPITGPSELSIMTGLYPWHHGMEIIQRDQARWDEWLKSDEILSSILKRHGYANYAMHFISKGDLSKRRLSPAPSGDKKFFLTIWSDVHDPYTPSPDAVGRFEPSISEADYPTETDVLRCLVASVISGVPPATSLRVEESGRPIGMSLGSPEEQKMVLAFASLTDPVERLSRFKKFDPFYTTNTLSSQCFWSFFSSETVRTARVLYDAKAYEVDAQLGRLFEMLRKKGLLKNTIVVVTSQHGEEFLEHGGVTHFQLFGETLRIPLVVSVPGLKQGRVIDGQVRNVDIMPTVLDVLGIDAPKGLDGESLLPCIEDRCPARPAFAYWDEEYSLRDERYTYMRRHSKDRLDERLFDRSADPRERTNIAPLHPEESARLGSALEKEIESSRIHGRWPHEIDLEIRRRIEKIGYW
jgi:arylsulfatase A-like enzyme